MRNPLNSWERSDTVFDGNKMCLGENDIDLMTRLIRGGAPHRIIDTGKLVESDNPDYPICIDNQWYFEGVEVKKTAKKAQLSSMYGEMKEGK